MGFFFRVIYFAFEHCARYSAMYKIGVRMGRKTNL